MRLLLIKIGLLNKKDQYAEIKVLQESRGTEQIKSNVIRQEEKAPLRSLANTAAPAPKDENPFSILSLTPPSSTKANNNPTSIY